VSRLQSCWHIFAFAPCGAAFWAGPTTCEAGASYCNGLRRTFEAQARTLAELTGWAIGPIRQRTRQTGQEF
jgi:hypothetical protein